MKMEDKKELSELAKSILPAIQELIEKDILQFKLRNEWVNDGNGNWVISPDLNIFINGKIIRGHDTKS